MLLAAVAIAATLTVDKPHGEVRFGAVVQPDAMSRMFGVKGHHAIVWKGGKSARYALFAADPSDHDVRIALDSLGARRGENLSPDAWNKRDDDASTEPDKRVEGTPVDVFIEWPGQARVPLASLLEEKGDASPLLAFRSG